MLTAFGAGNYSVTGEQWHYIRYEDGSEELYDRAADPREWTNLAASAKHAAQKTEMAKLLPKVSISSDTKKKKKKSKDSDL